MVGPPVEIPLIGTRILFAFTHRLPDNVDVREPWIRQSTSTDVRMTGIKKRSGVRSGQLAENLDHGRELLPQVFASRLGVSRYREDLFGSVSRQKMKVVLIVGLFIPDDQHAWVALFFFWKSFGYLLCVVSVTRAHQCTSTGSWLGLRVRADFARARIVLANGRL